MCAAPTEANPRSDWPSGRTLPSVRVTLLAPSPKSNSAKARHVVGHPHERCYSSPIRMLSDEFDLGGEDWRESLFQRGARQGADDSVDLLSVAQDDEQRDRLRAEPRGE